KTFTDNAGRDWVIEINVASLKRIKGLTGTDLIGLAVSMDTSVAEKLASDPILLCDVLYAACKPQADEREISDEEFGRAMAGDAIESATVALLEDIVGFCPSPRDRAALGRVLSAMRDARNKARDLVDQNLDRMIEGGEMDRVIEEAFNASTPRTSGDSSPSVPASPGSIRAP
ncbi:MAG: hypothetical protein AAFP26_13380, partial [Planctomycetota bacterium]